jgi:gamma-glutamyltranspeptidase/glutathione hydrolase
LTPPVLHQRSAAIDMQRASTWPESGDPGDTTWFGAIDGAGRAVSAIQSLFHEFGSGVVLEDTGVCWHNRGASFSLEAGHTRCLAPGRKPFHTLCPSLACLDDGRLLVFGAMGGEGQPQTQAAIFTRYLARGMSLQRAISAPRWLLGRSWGAGSDTLKLEARFPPQLVEALAARGHRVERVDAYHPMMGHAGAICRQPGGLLEGAADPRGDGCAAAY